MLTWLILFQVYDQIAAQHRIYVTPAQCQRQLTNLNSAGRVRQGDARGVRLGGWGAAAGPGAPAGPLFRDLVRAGEPARRRQAADDICRSERAAGQGRQAQCIASKNLGVTVNPQYGVWDYRTYSVVAATPTLAANPVPAASPSPVVTKAPC